MMRLPAYLILSGLILLGASSAERSGEAATAMDPSILLRSFPLDIRTDRISGCGLCDCCEFSCLLRNVYNDQNPPPLAFHGPYVCRDGCGASCSDALEAEDFTVLWKAVHDRDVKKVRQILAEFPDYVTWNADRNAIQVWGCGRIAANLPAPDLEPAFE